MNNKMVIEKMYADKKAYVEQTLKAMLMPMYDFGNIQYARDTVTNEEYVKFVEADGYPRYINVTGNNESAIGKEVCRMVCNQTPTGIIKVREKQIEINKLFGGM
jgi:hypothetical protein